MKNKENAIEELGKAKMPQEVFAIYRDIKSLNKTKEALNIQLAKLTAESSALLPRIIKASELEVELASST